MSTPLPPENIANTSGWSPPDALDDGVQLVLRLEDSAATAPLLEWLGRHPDRAGELAQWVAAQNRVRAALPAVAGDSPVARIAGYELRGAIGQGGMGVVYRAFDERLKREVAVKLLHGGSFSETERVRFCDEAEMVASLVHPAIVKVHEFNPSGATPFLVMELMHASLADWLRGLGPDRCRPFHEAARLVREVALAIQYAHDRLILHRDLKPGNILLDAEQRPYVADFGLARHLDASVSRSGVAGTAAYMAPEQARGEKHLTTAVDVHALGTILYELVAGLPPFGTGDIAAVLRRVGEEPAPPLRRYRDDTPADLEAICLRCLEKRPQDRYPSAQALADDLQRFLDGEPPRGPREPTVWSALQLALGRQQEILSMGTWRAAFWGVGHTGCCLACIQVGTLVTTLSWLVPAGLTFYLLGWALVLWRMLIAPRSALNAVERKSCAIHLGIYLGAVAVMPAQLFLHNGEVMYLFQPLAVVVGLGAFSWGLFWGRMYLIGVMMLVLAGLMPLVPVEWWPAAYGLILVGFQAWLGVRMRQFDREGLARTAGWRADSQRTTAV